MFSKFKSRMASVSRRFSFVPVCKRTLEKIASKIEFRFKLTHNVARWKNKKKNRSILISNFYCDIFMPVNGIVQNWSVEIIEIFLLFETKIKWKLFWIELILHITRILRTCLILYIYVLCWIYLFISRQSSLLMLWLQTHYT